MREFTQGRDTIIDYIGLHHAMPVLKSGTREPGILRVGEPDSGWKRVAWPEFFVECEKRGCVFAYDTTPGSFDWAFLPEHQAMQQLGPGKTTQLASHLRRVLGLSPRAQPNRFA